jgi:hypothetical protein
MIIVEFGFNGEGHFIYSAKYDREKDRYEIIKPIICSKNKSCKSGEIIGSKKMVERAVKNGEMIIFPHHIIIFIFNSFRRKHDKS